jgi:NAD(P)-dependent dehydrogenase (short-subunit alcohol dehydrogenase family)
VSALADELTTLFDLSGRTALVTGGSRGIGLAVARGLALAGADIAISARTEPELDVALTQILDGTGRRGMSVAADLSERSEAQRVADVVTAELGRVDILVSNAGASIPEPVDEIDDGSWDSVQSVHVGSAMALMRALVPGMKERRWGRVICTSSILGLQGRERRLSYSAAKGALIAMVRSAAVELGPFGITVNTIAPGPVATDARRWLSPDEVEQAGRRTALGRWAKPEELVAPVLMLAGSGGGFLTGTTLVVDGGWVVK